MKNRTNIIDEISDILLNAKIEERIEEEKALVNYLRKTNDPKLLELRSENNKTLIDLAFEYELAELLCIVVKKYPNIAKKMDTRGSLLHKATGNRVFFKVIDTALDSNIDLVKMQTDIGDTCLQYIAFDEYSHDILMKAVTKDIKLAKIKNKNGLSFLNIALGSQLNDVVIKAIEKDPSIIDEGLIESAFNTHSEDVINKILDLKPELLKPRSQNGLPKVFERATRDDLVHVESHIIEMINKMYDSLKPSTRKSPSVRKILRERKKEISD